MNQPSRKPPEDSSGGDLSNPGERNRTVVGDTKAAALSESVLRRVPNPVLAMNLSDSKVISANVAFAKLLDSTPEALRGTVLNIGEVLFEFEIEWLAVRKQLNRPGALVQRNLLIKPAGGEGFWASVTLNLIDEPGMGDVVILVLNDISSLVEIRATLAREREGFERAMRDAKSVQEARSRLLESIAGRLRHAVSAVEDNAIQLTHAGITQKAEQSLKELEACAKQMTSLVERITQVCLSESEVEPSETSIDLWEVLDDAAALIAERGAALDVETGYKFEVATHKTATCDPALLRECLSQVGYSLIGFCGKGSLLCEVEQRMRRSIEPLLRVRMVSNGRRLPTAKVEGLRRLLSGESSEISGDYLDAHVALLHARKLVLAQNGELFASAPSSSQVEIIVQLPLKIIGGGPIEQSPRASLGFVYIQRKLGPRWDGIAATVTASGFEARSINHLIDVVEEIARAGRMGQNARQAWIFVPWSRELGRQVEGLQRAIDERNLGSMRPRVFALLDPGPSLETEAAQVPKDVSAWKLPLKYSTLQRDLLNLRKIGP